MPVILHRGDTEPINVYLAGDTGPSGFGEATRGLISSLLDAPNINLTVHSHFWGLNDDGVVFGGNGFPDQRFVERLRQSGRINEDHFIDDPRDYSERFKLSLVDNLEQNETVDSQECLIRDFGGKEDVWIAVGSPNFAQQAPQDDDIHTIVSTDYNLDKVPKDWRRNLDLVDEMWVPSLWTKESIERTLGPRNDVKVMPYGINMRYEPTEYDCEVCLHNKTEQHPYQMDCLRDGKFNFLIVSRFYHVKGIYRMIRAYIEEFRSNENVRLMIKTTTNNQIQFNPSASIQFLQRQLNYPDVPEIGITTDPMEMQYLYDLMGHCDAFIQASRAECFGIAQLQAAWCGTPVIATNWSSQAEVLPQNNPGFLLIDDYTVETPEQEHEAFVFQGSDSYAPDSRWAVPSIQELQKEMRNLFEMSGEELSRRGLAARQHAIQNYKWEEHIEPRLTRIKLGAGTAVMANE